MTALLFDGAQRELVEQSAIGLALAAAQRDLGAARLAEHIRKVVDHAPPLTPEQGDRLAGLLHGGRAA